MSDESPESLRHQAGEDRMQEVGEKKKEKGKKTLLLMTKLDAVKGWSACVLSECKHGKSLGHKGMHIRVI